MSNSTVHDIIDAVCAIAALAAAWWARLSSIRGPRSQRGGAYRTIAAETTKADIESYLWGLCEQPLFLLLTSALL